MSNVYTVPKITAGQATPAKFNAPLEYIQKSLNALEAKLDGLANKSAILQWNATVSAETNIGDLVYFDSQNGSCFRPAIARLLGKPGSQGQSVQAPSSRVEGLVISLNPAVILKQGYYQSNAVISTIGTGASAGMYFLSPQTAGKATKDPGWNMRQPCISYYGDGKFSMLTNYLAHDNHHHSYAKLTTSVSASDYQGQDQKIGSICWIAPTEDIGQLSSATTAIFADGVLNNTDYQCTAHAVWYKGTDKAAAYIQVFNVIPFAYGDSVVRSIATQSLDIQGSQGNLRINLPAYQITQNTFADSAISNIQGRYIQKTPVVSKITAGAGIYLNQLSNGIYNIASDQLVGSYLDATDVYMNGTQRVATSLLTYNVFPAGKQTSYTMSLPITNPSNQKYTVSIWLYSRGQASCTVYVTFYWIPLLQTQATPIPTSGVQTTIRLSNNTGNSLLLQKTAIQQFSLASSGTLVAKLAVKAPAKDTYIYRSGFILDAIADQQEQDPSVTSDFLDDIQNVLTYNAKY